MAKRKEPASHPPGHDDLSWYYFWSQQDDTARDSGYPATADRCKSRALRYAARYTEWIKAAHPAANIAFVPGTHDYCRSGWSLFAANDLITCVFSRCPLCGK